ncbi:hypothetical protein APHAL10511_000479 [Amanita phalloides]|nr:hypothetical protein APHAL10511_000479 [Amanita phalloides]
MALTDDQHNENTRLLSSSGSALSCDETINVDPENTEEQPCIAKGQNELYLTKVIPMAIGLLPIAMNGNIIVALYTSIGSEMNQLQSASWIPTAYMLTQTSFQPLAGKLSDIFGRKACLLACYAIYAFGCLMFGLSNTMTQLIVARAISGIGSGGISILVTIIVSDIVPLRVRGTWQGALNTVFAAGSIIGAPLGGFFADGIGWRWAFLLQVPLFVIAFIAVLLTLHLPATNRPALSENIKRIDFGGAITLILSVFFLLCGLDRGGNISWSDWRTMGSLILFAVFMTLFAFIEASVASEPFAPPRIFFDRSLLPCYITGFFGAVASSILVFYMPLFCQVVEGKTALEAGIWLIIGMVAGLVGSLSSGFVMQHTGKYYALTVISYFLLLAGTGIAFLFSGVFVVSIIGVALGMGVTELGNGSGIITTLVALVAHAGQADQATATSIAYLFRSLGALFGLSAGSTLAQNALRYLLHKRLSGDNIQEIVRRVRQSLSYLNELDPVTKAIVVHSYKNAIQVTFLFMVAMGALAALASLFIKEKALTYTRS